MACTSIHRQARFHHVDDVVFDAHVPNVHLHRAARIDRGVSNTQPAVVPIESDWLGKYPYVGPVGGTKASKPDDQSAVRLCG